MHIRIQSNSLDLDKDVVILEDWEGLVFDDKVFNVSAFDDDGAVS